MAVKVRKDSIGEGLEAGRFHLPEAPRITLYEEQYPNLSDMIVGDTMDLEITARITDIDEDGRFGLELVSIQMHDKSSLIDKATSEIVHIGDLSADSLEKVFA